jgi:hypothetical protein
VCPGTWERADVQFADPELGLVVELDVQVAEELALGRMAAERGAEALGEERVVGDVVGVMMRQQDVGELELVFFDRGEQRLRRSARVDEQRGAAGAVGGKKAVGQPARMARGKDEHAGSLS